VTRPPARPAVVRLLLGVLLPALLLGSCAIGPESTPRDIERPREEPLNVSAGAAATGSGRIYLLAPVVPGVPTRLQAVARDVVEDAPAVLRALLAGPNAAEFSRQFRTALPIGLELIAARLRPGGVLAVDVTDEIQQLSGEVLVAAIAQIVFTASGLDGVRSVAVTVEGTTTQWPAGNGELQSTPLTVYDYPGIEPSSQPPYPGRPG